MDNLFCDKCFIHTLENTSINFFSGDHNGCSKHIFCEKCVRETCEKCDKSFKKILINKNIDWTFYTKFIPLENIKRVLQEAQGFQSHRRDTFNLRCYLKNKKDSKKHKSSRMNLMKMQQQINGAIQQKTKNLNSLYNSINEIENDHPVFNGSLSLNSSNGMRSQNLNRTPNVDKENQGGNIESQNVGKRNIHSNISMSRTEISFNNFMAKNGKR